MKTKNLRSEAAIKRVIKKWDEVYPYNIENKPVVTFRNFYTGQVMAEIDLRELIKKRKPLIGIKKQVEKIVRGSKKK